MAGRVRGSKVEQNWWTRMWMERLEEAVTKEQITSGKRLSKKAEVKISSGYLRGKVTYSSKPSSRVMFKFLRPASKDRKAAAQYIGQDSSLVAELMDGQLPRGVYDALKEQGVELIPPFMEAIGDEECTWHRRYYWSHNIDCRPPCQHQIAVWYAAGILIDADPFLLLELLGIDRQSILEVSRVAGATAGARRDGLALSGDDLGGFWSWEYEPSIHALGRGSAAPASRRCLSALEALPPPDATAPGGLFRDRLIGLLKAIEATAMTGTADSPAPRAE